MFPESLDYSMRRSTKIPGLAADNELQVKDGKSKWHKVRKMGPDVENHYLEKYVFKINLTFLNLD